MVLEIIEKISEFLKGTPQIYRSFWDSKLKHDFVLHLYLFGTFLPWSYKLQSPNVFTVGGVDLLQVS